MEAAQKLVLENENGQVVRTFLLNSANGHVIQRNDTRRIEIVENLEDLHLKKIKFNELGSIRNENLSSLNFDISGLGTIRLAREEAKLVKNLELHEEDSKSWYGLVGVISVFFAVMLGIFFTQPMVSEKLEQELKQQVVQIAKRIPVKQTQQANMNTKTVETKVNTKAPSIRRLGALAVLGSLKASNQKGGINLGAVNTTAGPGLGGTGGSGGVQTTMYGKGLVGAPLGPGANVQGGGGYGTKGKGGGQAGYGTMSLVGASGAAPVPLSAEASVGGGLDKDLIAAVINRNLGQIRFCYEQGLQGDPNLAGRVAVGFTIGGSGMVKTANVENTTLQSKMVEDCIILRLKSWKFPLPAGGVDVKVSYPFVLRRTGQG